MTIVISPARYDDGRINKRKIVQSPGRFRAET
jgi:hypothetical protein